MFLKQYLLQNCYVYGFFFSKLRRCLLNDLNLIQYQFNIAQRIIKKDVGNILKRPLEVSSSVQANMSIYSPTQNAYICMCTVCLIYRFTWQTIIKRFCKEKHWILNIRCRTVGGCYFLVQAMLPDGFPFHKFNITYYSWCLVPVWRL